MKKLDTEKLLRIYIFASSMAIVSLVCMTIYLAVAMQEVRVSVGYAESNATTACTEVANNYSSCWIRPLPYQEHKWFWEFWK